MFDLRFSTQEKRKIPGEGMLLEEKARAASSSLPLLLDMGKVSNEELAREMRMIDQPTEEEKDLRQLQGAAVLLAICRKVIQHILF